MERKEAWDLLCHYLKNENLRRYCLAVEAIMRALARRFQEDQDLWGLAGLLHDIDYELTKDRPEEHSLVGARILEEKGLPTQVVYAVRAHNKIHGLPREDKTSQALFAADPLSGFIVAAALILPEKKLEKVDVPFLLNRYKEKSFARGASREDMASCQELGLSLEDFMAIGLEAMKSIAAQLGL